ncbi:DNA polymerase III subunit delta [Novosphingobium sp. PC22D]|uniref:DNA polymerase III subunit delta n=1 Tax=Novosphingobium sp. PC22D TaxID=1962403 RepID=UPI000BF21A09|nr:DNA polymerase III subunit delta [Novosphingobium sp. PC22D]PEQ10683.1 DNA polymerase III subunit delta [Novosphingobium sp. PC22D]
MKATQKDFAGLAHRAAREARIFFFCGPDESGANDAAAKIASLLADPGERVEISGSDLRRDPVRLGDEARSSSLFGSARHIWVRAQGDEAHDAVATLIGGEVEPSPVLIIASGATDKSRTAKLLAGRDDSLVAMFWPPDLRSVSAAVRAQADGLGLQVASDIAERIARGCGLDTRLARSELEKLALYLDAAPERPRRASGADLDAVGAQTEDDGFATLVDAVLGGGPQAVAAELRRFRELGLNPVGTLLALERRCAQLASLAARMGGRGDVAGFVDAEAAARRIFWKDKAAIGAQLRVWRGKRLEWLERRLVSLHQLLLTNSADADLLLSQGLAMIVRRRQAASQ